MIGDEDDDADNDDDDDDNDYVNDDADYAEYGNDDDDEAKVWNWLGPCSEPPAKGKGAQGVGLKYNM